MRHTLTMQNIFLRQRAKEYTRKHYGRLIAMAVLVYALTTGLQWLLTLLGDRVMSDEIAALTVAASQYMSSYSISTTSALYDAIIALFASPKFWLYNAAYILVLWLFTSGVGLGQTAQYLRTGMGEQPRVLGAFTRMNQCFKALRLSFFAGLKTFLWALPGAAVMIIGAFITFAGATTVETVAQSFGTLLMLGGYVLTLTLVIRAALRYALSTYVLAESPKKGVIACVNESKALMRGHKWQLFKVGMPVMLMMLGVSLAADIVGTMLLTPLGLESNTLAVSIVDLISGASMLIFIPRLNMVYALFYLLKSDIARNPPADPAPEDASPASDPAENMYIRRKAKTLMDAHRWPLMGMCAIACGLPCLLLTFLPELLAPVRQLLLHNAVLPLLMIGVYLLSGGLMVGFLRVLLHLCRSGQLRSTDSVFRYMNMSLKGFGLNLLIGLKTFLWMLPGYALLLFSFAGIYMAQATSVDSLTGMESIPANSAAADIGLVLMLLVSLVLIFALAIPAVLRYALSGYILADKLTTGVFDCVRQSKDMMQGRKWQLFKLILPLCLTCAVVMLAILAALGALSTMLGTAAYGVMRIVMLIVTVAIAMYYLIRAALCCTLFYLKRAPQETPAE